MCFEGECIENPKPKEYVTRMKGTNVYYNTLLKTLINPVFLGIRKI